MNGHLEIVTALIAAGAIATRRRTTGPRRCSSRRRTATTRSCAALIAAEATDDQAMNDGFSAAPDHRGAARHHVGRDSADRCGRRAPSTWRTATASYAAVHGGAQRARYRGRNGAAPRPRASNWLTGRRTPPTCMRRERHHRHRGGAGRRGRLGAGARLRHLDRRHFGHGRTLSSDRGAAMAASGEVPRPRRNPRRRAFLPGGARSFRGGVKAGRRGPPEAGRLGRGSRWPPRSNVPGVFADTASETLGAAARVYG